MADSDRIQQAHHRLYRELYGSDWTCFSFYLPDLERDE